MNNTMNHSMNHSMTEPKEIFIMMVIMFIAGLLSSMNVWVDKVSDMRFHLNDIYMSLLMCSWCLILMGIYYISIKILIFGIIMTIIMIFVIRNQIFIGETQYLKGMIPHHSMAVLMSNKLFEKINNNDETVNINTKKLMKNIIDSQNDEIKFMKLTLDYKNMKML